MLVLLFYFCIYLGKYLIVDFINKFKFFSNVNKFIGGYLFFRWMMLMN